MKFEYVVPELEVLAYEVENVITTSADDDNDLDVGDGGLNWG